LNDYPRSDEVASAIELLGKTEVTPKELYPEKLYELAEEQQFDHENLDSALALYQYFMVEFPDSRLAPKADFAAAKVRLAQFIPADPPPTENPYRTADSLLAAESARQDSVAKQNLADSLSAPRTDTLKNKVIPESPDTVQKAPAVTVTYEDGDRIVDTTSATKEDIRLTDFIGGTTESEPDSVPATAKATIPDDRTPLEKAQAKQATDSAVKPPAFPDSANSRLLSDTTSHRPRIEKRQQDSIAVPKPQDKKKISLDNFPTQQNAVPPGSTSVATLKDVTTDQPADSSGALVGLVTPDSSSVDSLLAGTTLADTTVADSVNAAPIDSSMIWLFQHLANKYNGTEIGKEAERLSKGQAEHRNERQLQQPQKPQAPVLAVDTAGPALDSIPSDIFAFQDTTAGGQAIEDALREEIDKWPLMQDEPITIPEFEYPREAATSKFEGRVTLKIKIDFDGRVTEVEILKGTNVPLLDQEVRNTFLETYFDPLKIEPLHLGSYFIYYYEITLPEVYK